MNPNKMPKYRYIGKDKFFIKRGTILDSELTTWSVKKSNSNERYEVKLLYVDGAGFNGESMPINSIDLVEI